MLNLTGPVGKVMLLPQEDTTKKYIMVGTGADITPYLEFICRLFTEDTPASKTYKGEVWRVANSDVLLYDDEFQTANAKYSDNLHLDYALSREQSNKSGGKVYIQDKVEEYADKVFTKLENGAVIYFYDLNSLIPSIDEVLRKVAEI